MVPAIFRTDPGEVRVKEVIRESVQNLETSLGEVTPVLLKVSSDYRLGREAAASAQFKDCLETLRSMVELVKKFRELAGSGAIPEFPDYLKFEGQDKRLLGLVTEMSEAQKGRDWVFLADLIEYELVPILKEMSGGLSDVLRTLA